MGKSGPKGNRYEHQRETIAGLRRHRKSGRFLPVGNGFPSFGSDPPTAIHRFRFWQAKQAQDQDPLESRSSVDDLMMNELDAEFLAVTTPDLLLEAPIVAGVFKNHYRSLIFSNPKQAAIERDCEPIALLADVEDLNRPSRHRPIEIDASGGRPCP